ncbi:MAG: helix-turn-helix domain-containing protein [Pseudomonadota bacterium]
MAEKPFGAPDEPYALNQQELAERWRISPRTLERWRRNGTGPPFICLGGRVVYRTHDVLAYEQAHLAGR